MLLVNANSGEMVCVECRFANLKIFNLPKTTDKAKKGFLDLWGDGGRLSASERPRMIGRHPGNTGRAHGRINQCCGVLG